MKDNLIAIDPGASGGIAWCKDGIVHCAPMPEGMTAQAEKIREIRISMGLATTIMEKTGGYRPGNSGPAAATFARHCGHIEAILYCLAIPTVQVAPQTWMKSLGALPSDKAERKKAIKEEMSRRYPHLKVTLKVSDALGLLTYGMAQ